MIAHFPTFWIEGQSETFYNSSQSNFRGRPNISVGQPILVQLKYKPT